MCKWCELYRFTIRADKVDNDKETHFLKPCYCPMCGHNFALDDENNIPSKEKEISKNKTENYFVVKIEEHLCPDKSKRYFGGCDHHWDGYTLSDLKHAQRFSSIEMAKTYADWFFYDDDYVVKEMLSIPKAPKAGATKVEFNSLSHFAEEDFYLRSDSGSVVNKIFIEGKPYKFSKATVDKINKLVDAVNKLNSTKN